MLSCSRSHCPDKISFKDTDKSIGGESHFGMGDGAWRWIGIGLLFLIPLPVLVPVVVPVIKQVPRLEKKPEIQEQKPAELNAEPKIEPEVLKNEISTKAPEAEIKTEMQFQKITKEEPRERGLDLDGQMRKPSDPDSVLPPLFFDSFFGDGVVLDETLYLVGDVIDGWEFLSISRSAKELRLKKGKWVYRVNF